MQTELDSFLIEISALILAFKDEDGQPLVNKILDKTGMKGTGGHPASAPTCPLFQEASRQLFSLAVGIAPAFVTFAYVLSGRSVLCIAGRDGTLTFRLLSPACCAWDGEVSFVSCRQVDSAAGS